MEISTNEWEVLGVDLNSSSNFLYLSDGKSVGLSRSLQKKANNMKRDFSHVDFTKKKNRDKFDKRRGKVERNAADQLRDKAAVLLEYADKHHYKHIVLEAITNMKAEIDGNLAGWIGLEQFRDEVIRQAEGTGIAVSVVGAEYTSITCPHCHSIMRENRQSRDVFRCNRCGYRKPADYVAALNIRERITNDLLRERLLEFNGNGYRPKKGLAANDYFDVYDEIHPIELSQRKKKRAEQAAIQREVEMEKERLLAEAKLRAIRFAKHINRRWGGAKGWKRISA